MTMGYDHSRLAAAVEKLLQAGDTKAAMARRSGIHDRQFRAYVDGENVPGADKIVKMEEGLGLPAGHLMGIDREPDHDCWQKTETEALRGFGGRLDEKYRAICEVHRIIARRKIEQRVYPILLEVLRLYYKGRGLKDSELDKWEEALLRSA